MMWVVALQDRPIFTQTGVGLADTWVVSSREWLIIGIRWDDDAWTFRCEFLHGICSSGFQKGCSFLYYVYRMESRSMEKSTSVRLPRLHFRAIFDSCVLCLHPGAMKVDAVQGELDWLCGEKKESPGDSCQGREISQHCLQVSPGALGWIWDTGSRVLDVSVILLIRPRRMYWNITNIYIYIHIHIHVYTHICIVLYLCCFVFVFMVSSCTWGVFWYRWVMFL